MCVWNVAGIITNEVEVESINLITIESIFSKVIIPFVCGLGEAVLPYISLVNPRLTLE